MNQRIDSFVKSLSNLDFTDYQINIIKEYIEIGDNPLYGSKHSGSDAEHKGAEYIARKLEEIGVDSVEIIPVKADRCQFNDATITILDGENKIEIKPYGATTIGTGKEGITARVVDVGQGDLQNYDEKDVNGKIALIAGIIDIEESYSKLPLSIIEAEKRGAAAVIAYMEMDDLEDDTIVALPNNVKAGIPIVTVSVKDANLIRKYDRMINLHADIEFIPHGGEAYEVVGEIKGSESEERIVYSAHIDHFFRCIQDNVSAVATLLGVAKAMVTIGYKPKRTITFLFNGAHEMGHINSTSPDLKGLYELFSSGKSKIPENAVANINFEYTALEQTELRAITSYETMNSYLEFIKYMPHKMPGFTKIAEDIRKDDYYLATWSDAAIFALNGIPFFMNDAIGDQIYSGTSPYMGRDHSNKDNWEVFSKEALRTNTFWYSALSVFLDNTPLASLNFANRMDAVEFTDEEKVLLHANDIEFGSFTDIVENIKTHGKELYESIYRFNMTERKIDDRITKINKELLRINKHLGQHSDHLTSGIVSVMEPLYKAYLYNLNLMFDAKKLIEENKINDAAGVLMDIDVAAVTYLFDEDMAKMHAHMIEGENSTWAKGRTGTCFTLSEIMNSLKTKHEVDSREQQNVLDLLEAEILRAKELLAGAIAEAAAGFEHADNMILNCLESIKNSNTFLGDIDESLFPDTEMSVDWIKGFTKLPHRKTGTAEGKASAEYVKNTFEEIGLSGVKIEQADSLSMEMAEYKLVVGGEELEAFYANGTNRGAENGIFESGMDEKEVEIVYLGRGSEDDFQKEDVAGKIVLCDVNFHDNNPVSVLKWSEEIELYDPSNRMKQSIKKYDIFSPNDWPYNYFRAMDHGAAGFVGVLHHFMDCHYYHEDYSFISSDANERHFFLPAMWVSKETGNYIKKRMGDGKKISGFMKMKTIYAKTKANNVIGHLPGLTDDMILIHSHHDAVCDGAVQDASGMSEVFAIAKYFAQLPIEKREKTLMFAAMDSHYTDYEGHAVFWKERKKNKENILMDVAIEHIAQEMDLDEDNQIVLTGEPEMRLLYVSKELEILPAVREMLSKYGIDKTVIIPSDKKMEGEYKEGLVCSDATVSWEEGIPVVSMLATPMYLYHNSDTLEKVHIESLRPVGMAFANLVSYAMKMM